MEYRSLGRTGTKVSTLCLGCMRFGSPTTYEDSATIIGRAIDAGINFLDTANVYAYGQNEEIVGKALKQNGKRDRIVLATKVHGRMDEEDPNAQGNHRRHIIEQCEASLRRLQTDYIDLYQLHRPCPDIPIDETLRALDDLIRAGKVRYIGTSTFAAWQILESLWASKELGLNRIVCEQPPYHLLDRRVERELIPFARTYGVAIIPWSPIAAGFFSDRYKRGKLPPEDSRFGSGGRKWEDSGVNDAAFDVLERVCEIAKEKSCSPSQVALSWCASQPGVTSPIVGPRTIEQLEDNLGALEVEITDEDRKRLDEVSTPGRVIIPFYEADFGPHLHRWF